MLATKAKQFKIPSYREHKPYGQGVVTLTDSVTRKRKEYWLGDYQSPASVELYNWYIAQWIAKGRRHPSPAEAPKPEFERVTISEVILDYKRFVDEAYKPPTRATIYMALRVLRQMFGSTAAADFGPNRLRLVRDQMIKGDAGSDPPRKPWSRETVNKAIHQIRAMFKWASSHEMLPSDVYHQLRTLAALRRGRSEARETEGVQPVAIEIVEATKKFLNRQVKALVDLQLLTGARGGELFRLCATDFEMDDKNGIWTVRPRDHKTAHHDHQRVIYFGPKAQAVIRPFLVGRPVNAYLFSPAEAEADRREELARKRRTPLHRGNHTGTNRSEQPKRKPGDHYTAASYRRAIERACAKPFPKTGTTWHPHQLRHTAGTQIRKEFGLEAARIILGHSSALVTDAVYAERDMERVVDVMRKVG